MEKLNIALDTERYFSSNNCYLTARNYEGMNVNHLIENLKKCIETYETDTRYKTDENDTYTNYQLSYDLQEIEYSANMLIRRERKLKKINLRESRIKELIEAVKNSIEVNQATTVSILATYIKKEFPYYCKKKKEHICLPIGISKEILIRLCESNNFIQIDRYYIRIK